ncbi:MAG TPA: nucleotidyltransferase family protein [Chitinophagaceae bacterium]|nr:nucleotidyltransferase family protein [Chitinophagaceae bacterium]
MKEAIILAGGLGTRLRSVVSDLPKCMADVAGRPFLAYVLDHLQQQGIERFIFALGYKSEAFTEFIDARLSKDNYALSIEDEPLGTGGAIKLACTQAKQKTVLVANGDTLFKVDTSYLIHFHDMCAAHCTLSLKRMVDFDRYGVVHLNKDYSIRSFEEKQFYKQGFINGGVYALHAEKFLQEELPQKFSFEKDYLEQLYTKRRMYGVVQDAYFIDIGIPEDYARAQDQLAN